MKNMKKTVTTLLVIAMMVLGAVAYAATPDASIQQPTTAKTYADAVNAAVANKTVTAKAGEQAISTQKVLTDKGYLPAMMGQCAKSDDKNKGNGHGMQGAQNGQGKGQGDSDCKQGSQSGAMCCADGKGGLPSKMLNRVADAVTIGVINKQEADNFLTVSKSLRDQGLMGKKQDNCDKQDKN